MAVQKNVPAKSKRSASGVGNAELGSAGELHQQAAGQHPPLTTNQGVQISDDQNSLRVGDLGPTLLEDFVLREKIMHFDHERIPERIVHARGTGVHGFFELTNSLSKVTTAKVFTHKKRGDEEFTDGFLCEGGADGMGEDVGHDF